MILIEKTEFQILDDTQVVTVVENEGVQSQRLVSPGAQRPDLEPPLLSEAPVNPLASLDSPINVPNVHTT